MPSVRLISQCDGLPVPVDHMPVDYGVVIMLRRQLRRVAPGVRVLQQRRLSGQYRDTPRQPIPPLPTAPGQRNNTTPYHTINNAAP